MSGWISIHRKITDNWVWKEKPFSKGQAWIDILMMVNHENKKILLGNELIEVERGSRITSIRQLCDRWGWSNTKVKNFLNLLEEDKMLVVKSDSKKTTLTVVNYNDYQLLNDNKSDTETIVDFLKREKGNKKSDTETTLETVGNAVLENNHKSKKHQKNDTKATVEHTNNNDNNDNNYLFMYSENLKKIVSLLENNIGVIPPILIESVAEYADVFDVDMFAEAIKIASNKKIRTVNYVLGILKQWKDNNIIDLSDLEALRKEKQLEREQKQQQNRQALKKPTKFHNFEQRSDKYTADDLEDIAARKRREHSERIRREATKGG